MSNKPKNVKRNFIKPIKTYIMPKKPKRKDSHLRVIQEYLREKTKELAVKKYGKEVPND